MTDEEAEEYSQQHHDEGQYIISSKAFREIASAPTSGGHYLLHSLCKNYAPLKEIRDALNAYPPAASLTTDDGWLPLHLICRNSDDFESISLILGAYPAGAAVAEGGGWYPLHQLCRYSSCLDAIQMMYEAYPEAAKVKSSKGSTPLCMLRKYYPSRLVPEHVLVNHGDDYEVDVTLALSVNILQEGDNMAPPDICSKAADEGLGEDAVAEEMDHSDYMSVTKFEDICNLLGTQS